MDNSDLVLFPYKMPGVLHVSLEFVISCAHLWMLSANHSTGNFAVEFMRAIAWLAAAIGRWPIAVCMLKQNPSFWRCSTPTLTIKESQVKVLNCHWWDLRPLCSRYTPSTRWAWHYADRGFLQLVSDSLCILVIIIYWDLGEACVPDAWLVGFD